MRLLYPAELAAYDHVPLDVSARVRVIRVPVLPPGADGMTLGRFVLVRRDEGTDRTGQRKLLAHELVHARQWAELGVGPFLRRYLSAYAGNLCRLRRHRAAYLAIPLEEEARAEAERWAEGQGSS